jgi:small basic protein
VNLVNPTIGTVVVPLLIVAIVAGLKSVFGPLKDRTSQITAFLTGLTLYTLAFAIEQQMIPGPALPYIILAVSAAAATLGAMGFYDLAAKPLARFLSRSR